MLSREEDRKIVLFSEWTNMLNLIEPLLDRHELQFVRLDGSVPQKNVNDWWRSFESVRTAGCSSPPMPVPPA